MIEPNHLDSWRGSLWGMFVGDALAMPVHWYYDVAALQRDFGVVRDFQAPRNFHPNSIMSLASTGDAGRGSQQGEVVGNVILHGKKHLWGQPNRHYHQGLQSGDNTLNLLCVRVLLRSMNETGRYDASDFLREYIAFMTTADSHRDTYAESYHRAFFANYARGVPADRCAGAENHDTASIGGLVGLPPVIMAALRENGMAAVDRTLLEHLRLTHRSRKLERYAVALGRLLPRLLQDSQPRIGSMAWLASGPDHLRLSELRRSIIRSKSIVIYSRLPFFPPGQHFPVFDLRSWACTSHDGRVCCGSSEDRLCE